MVCSSLALFPSGKNKGGSKVSLEEFKAKFIKAEEEAMLKGNVDALDEVYAPDLVIRSEQFPYQELKGIEARKQQVRVNSQVFQILKLDWDEMVGEGDTIAYRYTLRLKHTGESPMVPVPPTGKELVVKGSQFLHLKDGKVSEVISHIDALGMLQQLGVIPKK
jgi:predicted ester cyclase